jgi:hypothetical protein
MKDIKITRWPAIIVANYRTGSTVYATHLAETHNVPYYLEPWQRSVDRNSNYGPHVNGMKQNFYDHYHSGDNRYVLKLMPEQISKCTPYDILLKSDSFKIKLYRENEIDSIVSHYIGKMRKKWWTEFGEKTEDYILDVDNGHIAGSAFAITQNNFLLHNLDYDYDEVITYESLGYIPNLRYVKTHMPNNINEIKKAVSETYNNLLY